MAQPNRPLPEEVLTALQRGSLFDAIKLLRKSGVANLAEAKALLEAEARRINARKSTSAHAAAPSASSPQRAPGAWPPAATEALRRGHKIEAIRLLREHSGLGLKEAKDAVEAHAQTMVPTVEGLSPRDGLSPGEVPRTSSVVWWLVIIAVIGGAAVYHYFLRGSV
ncbi:ribosomal protein L7/L12 [Aquabacterium sp.]|uniref:ribosomal protein L7/L12 n=1 Tax=Aquabacterium sp. TaxID=1872578 RepID=UPI002B88B41D|nr:ribosomal protein L7/L12 [Aquabacterium sp.]HSW03186.1 ribosomal protein L7/L12 [Aquabacterium sp.]